jgi:hypothetical protein
MAAGVGYRLPGAMGVAGNLKTMELAELLQWLAQGRKTGTLVVDDGTVEKRIFFRDGKIVSAASTDPKEYLGHFLVSHGFITEKQLAEVVARQEAEKTLLGKILVDMGLLAPEQLDRMLRLKAEEGIFDLFGWKEGEFRFHDDELPAYQMVPISLDVTGVVLEAGRRQDEWQRFRIRIPSPLCVPVKVVDDLTAGVELEDEGQRRVLLAVDDQRSVEEIALETHASEYYVCEALYPQVVAKRLKVVRPRALPDPAAAPLDGGQVSGKTLLRRGEKHLAAQELAPALRYLRAARSLDPDNQTIQLAAEQAERAIRQALQAEGVIAEAVPQLVRPLEDVLQERVSAKAGFLLSRVDGQLDIAAILKISPMNPLEGLLVFRELTHSGLIRLARR